MSNKHNAFPGEERVFKKFLFFPRFLPVGRIGPVEWRWFQFAYIRCVYDWNAGNMLGENGWFELYFVE